MWTQHVTSYLARAWRSWLCRMAVRVKSGRMASRLVSRPQWAVRRSGVTLTTGSTAKGSPCRESCEVMELLVSVSLWPARHINRGLTDTLPEKRFTYCKSRLCLWLPTTDHIIKSSKPKKSTGEHSSTFSAVYLGCSHKHTTWFSLRQSVAILRATVSEGKKMKGLCSTKK